MAFIIPEVLAEGAAAGAAEAGAAGAAEAGAVEGAGAAESAGSSGLPNALSQAQFGGNKQPARVWQGGKGIFGALTAGMSSGYGGGGSEDYTNPGHTS